MKVAFVWDFNTPIEEFYAWNDGLAVAVKLLEIKYELEVFPIVTDETERIYDSIHEFGPDIILCWGSLDRPSFGGIKEFGKPTALCFAGGSTEHRNVTSFDLIFVENSHYFEKFLKQGVNVVKAFGTNDMLFAPMGFQKRITGFYPAAFVGWKRHNLFSKAVGEGGFACGKMFESEKYIVDNCSVNGVLVSPALAYTTLAFFYNQSKYVLVTASEKGGSQRVVLEAMACSVPVIVMSDAPQNVEYVEESGVGIVAEANVESIKEAIKRVDEVDVSAGRIFVQNTYSAALYAEKLYNGLMSIKS